MTSLRYPGGEEANSYEWAPPPYTAQTKPQPVLTTGSGFPGGDWLFYDRFRGSFQSSVMNFDQLMDISRALSITDPYLVLNHDSVNIGGPRASPDWGYVQLKQAAIAWAQYIVQKNYTVRPACFPVYTMRGGHAVDMYMVTRLSRLKTMLTSRPRDGFTSRVLCLLAQADPYAARCAVPPSVGPPL